MEGTVHEKETVDFFISHAGGDSAWAEWIDQVLRRANHSTITDLYEFEVGRNFILLMEDALQRADKLLLIWSSKARARYMVEVEWSSAMARNRDRVIPIVVEECEVPAVLSATMHINLTKFSDGQTAGEALVQALHGRERPTDTVNYPRTVNPVVMPFSSELQRRVSNQHEAARQDATTALDFSLDTHIFPRPGHSMFTVSEDVSEVWMIAKGFDSFLHDNARGIKHAIARGTTFRFLMHDPGNTELMKMMALTSYSNRDHQNVALRLKSAVDQIRGLAEDRGDAVELRLVSWPIVTGCTFFGPNDRLGLAYMEIFGYRISLNERQALTVSRARDPQLFRYLREHFVAQWRDAEQVVWDD
ncbi:toll/interleukin-1 receptor domain-containing protein [Sphaerisporangium dianthi]|uniref:Toll/interleukin-1 receptor domain-containing protein n=1 Tax=Sphaerisporangium dianthi TaxID=1436120 RepID=A0ABV9CNH8_9ACTN